jgi:hypothetical protein
MPLPLLFIIPAAATGILGIGKGIKAAADTNKAKNVNTDANNIITSAKQTLEYTRKKSGEGLKALGGKKLFILDKSITRFIDTYGKLKNVDLQDSVGLEELKKFRLDNQSFADLKQMSGYAASLVSGVAGGALGGALTAFGAYGAATTFAAASTGTAISTLSGVAATNATLAFFGGGSLAVGGLGMAGGAVVLGGLVAGPALAIMGFVLGAKASSNLHNAYSNLAEAKKMAEELKTASVACNSIRRRSCLFERLLIRLDALFMPLILEMEKIIKEKGEDYSGFNQDQKHTIAAVAATAVAIKSVLDTPILTSDGKVTDESAAIAAKIKEQFFA